MNYPDIWVYIFNFLKIFENPVYLFCTFQIMIYLIFSKIILIKNKSFNYLYFLFLFSPVMILMLERGNNDLSIFFILFLSIVSFHLILIIFTRLIVLKFRNEIRKNRTSI
jgi:hypothetical protein